MNRHGLKSFLATNFVLIFLLIGLLPHSAHAQIAYRTVALSGQHLAGTPDGTVFRLFHHPVMNANGNVAFIGSYYAPSSQDQFSSNGIWLDNAGSLSLIVSKGPAPSGATGTSIGSLGDDLADFLNLNDNNQSVYSAELLQGVGGVTTSNDSTLWTNSSGTNSLVAREGTNGFLSYVVGPSAMNNSGTLIVNATNTINGTNASGHSLYSWNSGIFTPIATSNDIAPGTSGIKFSFFTSDPKINSSGKTIFSATLAQGPNTLGVWSNASGVLALVARQNDQAPGLPAGVLFNSNFGSQTLNGSGALLLSASLKGSGVNSTNDTALWSNRSGNVLPVVRDGDIAPGLPVGTTFDLSPMTGTPSLLDASNHVFFWSKLTGPNITPINDESLWSDRSGSLSLIARGGDQAPGMTPGTTFGADPNSKFTFFSMSVNTSGAIAFTGWVTENGQKEQGIWAEDPNGNLQLIACTGHSFEVAPGDIRTIDMLELTGGSNGQDGNARAFNDDFTLAFYLRFNDGSGLTGGIFTATLIPEPSTWAMIFCSAIGMCFFAARRNTGKN